MSTPNVEGEPPNSQVWHGCLLVAASIAAIVAALGYIAWQAHRSQQREFAQRQAERRATAVAEIKSGDDGSRMSVYDAELIAMLADDPECVASLTTLKLSMFDLSNPHVAAAKKLTNVKRIVIYDCRGVDDLLETMQGMSSIEEMHVDAAISPDGVRLLAKFPNLRKVRLERVIDDQTERLLRDTLPGVRVEIPYPE